MLRFGTPVKYYNSHQLLNIIFFNIVNNYIRPSIIICRQIVLFALLTNEIIPNRV